MSANLRFPNISGKNDAEKWTQVQSYLHQLVQQLNWAFDNIETGTGLNGSPVPLRGSNASESEEAKATFNSIKSLIIKSADIITAYYDAINSKLKGIYVAQSDFGDYMEQTEAVLNATSTNIEQLFKNVQEIITDIENIGHTSIGVDAYINSGLLYYDDQGVPVYGLEIGQRTEIDGEEVFNKYAQFTSAKLSFYDSNGNEVAYISDKKLYITHIEIRGSLTKGGFVEIIQANGDIVEKWVGVGG